MLKDAHKVFFFCGASLWQRRTSALSARLIFGTFRVERRTTALYNKTDIVEVLRSKTYSSFEVQDGYFGRFVFKVVQQLCRGVYFV